MGFPMEFDRDDSLGYRINRLARSFQRALERRIAPLGVAHGSFKVLMILAEEEGLGQTEIARRLGIEQPTVANTLRRMIRDGLATMHADPDDGRRVSVYLTEKARALLPGLLGQATALNEKAAVSLNGLDRDVFLVALERMERCLDSETSET
jgi:DNA-binding MarR family transcriptional regulator